MVMLRNDIINAFVSAIKNGKFTINEVPEEFKEEVLNKLEE